MDSNDDPFGTSTEVGIGKQVLMSDSRFVAVRKKGIYDKKIVVKYSLSMLYELCLAFKYSGINLSDVFLNVPGECFPAVILTDRTPFEVIIAPSEIEEEED